ncbi:MAG: hypothetical protein JXQ27_13380 [Acidobacteria bacterium]|nr:hypothetical protein [Acidobacteriota bacterium]
MSASPFDTDDIGWREWLYLPVYALRRLPMSLRLAIPFGQHPLTALRNVPRLLRRNRDAFAGHCLGVADRSEFLAYVAGLSEAWHAGRLPRKPEVWLMQAYCQKPVRCACAPPADSPYRRPGAQRRFNETCVFDAGRPGPVCDGGTCRIGLTAPLTGPGPYLDLRLKIMLDERQMADFWQEMLAFQARHGFPIPYVMELCPFALWLARRTLFQLKCPVGVAFFFEGAHRCRTFAEYVRADAGRKEPTAPTVLIDSAQAARDDLVRRLRVLAHDGPQSTGIPGPATDHH